MPAGGQRRMLAAARAGRERGRRRRRRAARPSAWLWIVGGTAALVVVITSSAAWVSVRGGPAPRTHQYPPFTACLLTDSHGIAATQAAPVWAGMQDASVATEARVEYLPVMSGSTAAAAHPYLASLLQRHCNVVVAIGAAQVAAVAAQAARFPSVRFVIIGRAAAGSHVTAVEGPAGKVREDVAALIAAAVHDSL